MKKIVNVAWKDLITTFRDPSALVLMLVTPLALTLAIAFAFGGFGGGAAAGTGLSKIPVVVVDGDEGELGAGLIDVLLSDDLDDLLDPLLADDPAEAKATVDTDEAAAAVLIPEKLTARVVPSPSGVASAGAETSGAAIEVYANPARPVSVGVVRSVVGRFAARVNATVDGTEVTISQLIRSGRISPEKAAMIGDQLAERVGRKVAAADMISIAGPSDSTDEGGDDGFNYMAYMAPSMAVLFLMFTVTSGGRTIITERDQGTLFRMLTTPSSSAAVLVGKVVGTYVTGLAQMAVLVAASTILFGVTWGAPVAVAALVLSLVAAATGWGIAIAAYARTAAQANVVGTAVTLVFGIGAGHFFPRELLPGWLRTVSFVSPNAWGLEGFLALASGGGLSQIARGVAALMGMAVVMFGMAVLLFRRQFTR